MNQQCLKKHFFTLQFKTLQVMLQLQCSKNNNMLVESYL